MKRGTQGVRMARGRNFIRLFRPMTQPVECLAKKQQFQNNFKMTFSLLQVNSPNQHLSAPARFQMGRCHARAVGPRAQRDIVKSVPAHRSRSSLKTALLIVFSGAQKMEKSSTQVYRKMYYEKFRVIMESSPKIFGKMNVFASWSKLIFLGIFTMYMY